MWKDHQKNKDKFYEQILGRAKDSLPELAVSDNRFVIPELASEVQGNRTFVSNFKEITGTLNRPDSHFLKFLTNELGTNGNVEGNRAVFQGKHSSFQLKKLFKRYLNDYLICPECSKPDTRFIQQGRITMMKCDACGATTSIRSLS